MDYVRTDTDPFLASNGFGDKIIKAFFAEAKRMEMHRAKIHGNTIEWSGDEPEKVKVSDSVDVYVTFVEDAPVQSEPNGKLAVEILKRIADRGGIPSIPDPVSWQREIRKDRPLPGRE